MTLDSPSNVDALRRLEQFSLTDWCRWIQTLAEERDCDPELDLGRTSPHRILIWLYEHGLQATAIFSEALGATYERSTPARPEVLFHLLQAISVIRPPVGKDLLLRHLKTGRFDRLSIHGVNLKTLALTARANYEITTDLLAFVDRSAVQSDDFGYRLAALRTWAKRSAREALDLLALLLPFLHNPDHRRVLGHALRGIAWAESYKHLYDFLFADVGEHHEGLMLTLREWVAPWRPLELPDDPYALLLAARLSAGHRPFVAEELLRLVRTFDDFRLRDNSDDVRNTLQAIWDLSEANASRWSRPRKYGIGPSAPWLIVDEHDLLETTWREDALLETERSHYAQQVSLADISESARVQLSRAGRSIFAPSMNWEDIPTDRLYIEFESAPKALESEFLDRLERAEADEVRIEV